MQVRTSRKQEPVNVEAIRIKIHDKEFLLQQVADGLKVVLVENDDILVRPQTGNSVVIVTRQKNNIE